MQVGIFWAQEQVVLHRQGPQHHHSHPYASFEVGSKSLSLSSTVVPAILWLTK